jgi:23S rRNA (uracil1939-C5)-methyltransferase
MNKPFPNKPGELTVTIESIGMRGDGIANADGVRYYVSFTAPGDVVSIRPVEKRADGYAAAIRRVLQPGDGRGEPACRHFGTCGGCALQHLTAEAIAGFKRDMVVTALAQHGFADVPVNDAVAVPPGRRRRVRFAANRGGRVAFGFNEPRSNRVIDIGECPAVTPGIAAMIEPLRKLAASTGALGRRAEILVTETDTGLDVTLRPKRPADLTLNERMALANFAERHDIARLGWDGPQGYEPLAARRAPAVTFGDVAVALPPDAFLQPSSDGERVIVAAVLAGAEGARKIADLYAGCGALTFPLSSVAPVHPVEGNGEMVQAIRQAAAGHPVTAEVRDLARQPLSPEELQRFDTVIFDPPRPGARDQAVALARSAVATVIAVSCNPATLARDLRLLADGGYGVESIRPVDQFPWSPHTEVVAVLRKR